MTDCMVFLAFHGTTQAPLNPSTFPSKTSDHIDHLLPAYVSVPVAKSITSQNYWQYI